MIYVASDTHGDMSVFSSKAFRSLKAEDTLIIAGDFGFLWEDNDRERKALKKIGARKHRTVFSLGENDAPALYEAFPEAEIDGNRVLCLGGNLFMAAEGIYEAEGKKLLLCGNGVDRTEDEEEEYLKRVLSAADNEVYGVITYEPPFSVGEFLCGEYESGKLGFLFDRLKGNFKFEKWYFGRLHKDVRIPGKYRAVFDVPQII